MRLNEKAIGNSLLALNQVGLNMKTIKITEENILNALKHSKDDIENLKESLGPYDGQLILQKV